MISNAPNAISKFKLDILFQKINDLKKAQTAKNKKLQSLLDENLALTDLFSGQLILVDGAPYEEPIKFLIKEITDVVDSKCLTLLKLMLRHDLFNQWLTGTPIYSIDGTLINPPTADNLIKFLKYSFTINPDQFMLCLLKNDALQNQINGNYKLFTHALHSKNLKAIAAVWNNNSALHNLIRSLNYKDKFNLLIKVLTSSRNGRSKFITEFLNWTICGNILIEAINHLKNLDLNETYLQNLSASISRRLEELEELKEKSTGSHFSNTIFFVTFLPHDQKYVDTLNSKRERDDKSSDPIEINPGKQLKTEKHFVDVDTSFFIQFQNDCYPITPKLQINSHTNFSSDVSFHEDITYELIKHVLKYNDLLTASFLLNNPDINESYLMYYLTLACLEKDSEAIKLVLNFKRMEAINNSVLYPFNGTTVIQHFLNWANEMNSLESAFKYIANCESLKVFAESSKWSQKILIAPELQSHYLMVQKQHLRQKISRHFKMLHDFAIVSTTPTFSLFLLAMRRILTRSFWSQLELMQKSKYFNYVELYILKSHANNNLPDAIETLIKSNISNYEHFLFSKISNELIFKIYIKEANNQKKLIQSIDILLQFAPTFTVNFLAKLNHGDSEKILVTFLYKSYSYQAEFAKRIIYLLNSAMDNNLKTLIVMECSEKANRENNKDFHIKLNEVMYSITSRLNQNATAAYYDILLYLQNRSQEIDIDSFFNQEYESETTQDTSQIKISEMEEVVMQSQTTTTETAAKNDVDQTKKEARSPSGLNTFSLFAPPSPLPSNLKLISHEEAMSPLSHYEDPTEILCFGKARITLP